MHSKTCKTITFIAYRKPATKKVITTVESPRYSLDVSKDLQDLIRDRKRQKNLGKIECASEETAREKMSKYVNRKTSGPNVENVSNESFEALEKMCEKTASDPNSTLFRYLQQNEELKQVNCDSHWNKADESFEILEKMCDKTASDPNSTLFEYLHSDHKEQVLAAAKKRSTEAIVEEKNIGNFYNGFK